MENEASNQKMTGAKVFQNFSYKKKIFKKILFEKYFEYFENIFFENFEKKYF